MVSATGHRGFSSGVNAAVTSSPYRQPSSEAVRPVDPEMSVGAEGLTAAEDDKVDDDVEERPTDYSLRFQEVEENELMAASNSTVQDHVHGKQPEKSVKTSQVKGEDLNGVDVDDGMEEDSIRSYDAVKTYCTEGTPFDTPFVVSSAGSLNDLRMEKGEEENWCVQLAKPPSIVNLQIFAIYFYRMSSIDSDIETVDKDVKEEVETCVDDDDVQADDDEDQDAPRIFGGTETPMTQEVPRMFGGTETPMTRDAPRMFGGTETPMTGYGEGDGGPRVYCTEDTPGVFSRADSLSSLDSCEETSAAARQQVHSSYCVTHCCIKLRFHLGLN